MKKVMFICVSAAYLFIVGCPQTKPDAEVFTLSANVSAASDFDNFHVEFKAKKDDPVLAVKSNPKKCKISGKPRKGCLGFEEDRFGTIKLSLQDDHGVNKNQCGDGGVKFVITKVEATIYADADDSDKGDYDSYSKQLPQWVVDSFWPVQDAKQGILYESAEDDLSDARTSVHFMNLNRSKATERARVLWYRVTAKSCVEVDGERDVAISDPRIENKGLK